MTSADKQSKQPSSKSLTQQSSIPSLNWQETQALQNPSNLSPAELYIKRQSELVTELDNSQSGNLSSTSTTNSQSHLEKMQDWRNKEIEQVYKHEPYRYRYGTSSLNHSIFHRDNLSMNKEKK